MVNQKEVEEQFLIHWHIPEDIKSSYATNMVVQYTGEEFILSFFEVKSPIILGSPDEQKAAKEKIESVRADCVARIVVSPNRMKTFINVMQRHLHRVLPDIEPKKEDQEQTDEPINT